MKKILLMLILGMVLLAAACGKPEAAAAEADAAPAPEPPKTVEAFGIVEADHIENISLDIQAEIESINVKEGQLVSKGDILLTLNLEPYKLLLQSKQIELKILNLEAEKLAVESSNPELQKLANDLRYAEEQLNKAEAELDAQKKLYESGALSKSQYDEHVKAVEAKSKSVQDIRFSMESLLRSNGLEAAIRSERAAAVEGEIRQLKDKLNKDYVSGSNIVCPIEKGIVTELGYKAGDGISSEKKIMSLMDADTLVVKANVAEEFIKDVKLGAKVDIIPVADKNRKYAGRVSAIAQKAQLQNGETVIPVEITIENNDSFLLPDFNVDVSIYIE